MAGLLPHGYLLRMGFPMGVSLMLSDAEEGMNENLPLHPNAEELNQFLTNHPNAEELKLAGGLEEIKKNLEQFQHNETALIACKECGKRLLKFGSKIHEHESHSGMISGDVDNGVDTRMKEEVARYLIDHSSRSIGKILA